MISRKEQYKKSVLETYVINFLTSYLAGIDPASLTYIDEIYQIAAARVAEIRKMGTVTFNPIDQWDWVNSEYYRLFIGGIRRISEFNLMAIPELYAEMQDLSNSIITISEGLSKKIATCEEISKVVEGVLHRRTAVTSVKDEMLVYDTMGAQCLIVNGTLAVDRRAGSVTLGVASEQELNYSVSAIRVDKPKGVIDWDKLALGCSTWFPISNGFFNSRIFGNNPLFENDAMRDPGRMKDGDLETSFLVEYNTFSEDALNVTIELALPNTRVDAIEIVFDPADGAVSLANSLPLPDLMNMGLIENGGKVSNVTDLVMDNTITIKGAAIGRRETQIEHRAPDPFPVASILLNRPNVEGIVMTLQANCSQDTYYVEKAVRDARGVDIKQFNYFETLILNKYDPPAGFYDPKLSFNTIEKNELAGQMYSDLYLVDKNIHLRRYAMAIKDMKVLQRTYVTNGTSTTENLNSTSRKIAGVDLYVNEIIPTQCSIRYFFSPDQNTWYEISPQTRADARSLPRRILFSGDILPEQEDLVVICDTNKVYLKVTMDGVAQRTPILKAYAARIKLI